MKKLIMSVLLLISANAMIAEGASVGFVPTACMVGAWGGYSSFLGADVSNYYWAEKDGDKIYNLGRIEDAAAKARFSGCLSAQSQGRTLALGIWALTWEQISSVGRHEEIPETFQIR